jgi:carbon monoxide dehydrogenase subunit G
MDLTHRFTVPTPVDETWAHFQDIASVAQCFPGATVASVDGDTFSGSVKVKLGPIALVYNGSGTFVEKDEAAHRFVVEAKGKDKRGNGTAGAHVTLTMTDVAGSTDVEVVTDLAITGKPAQFGRGVMQDVSDKLLGQFVACLEQRLSGPADTSADTPAVAAGDSPATAGLGGDQDAGPASVPSGAAAVGSPPEDPDAGPASVPGPAVVPDEMAASGAAGTADRQGLREPPAPKHAAAPPPDQDDSLDLGAALLPVLARSYWRQGAGALAVLLLLLWWRRRR